MTARIPTGQEEAVSAPRCNIWWHLLICGGLVLSALTALGTGFLRNANKCADLEVKVTSQDTLLREQSKDIDEVKADVKELLRRTPANKVSER